MSTGKNFETASLHDRHKLSVIDTTIVALAFYHRGRGRESEEALASPIAGNWFSIWFRFQGWLIRAYVVKSMSSTSPRNPTQHRASFITKIISFQRQFRKSCKATFFFSFLSWFSCLMFNFFFYSLCHGEKSLLLLFLLPIYLQLVPVRTLKFTFVLAFNPNLWRLSILNNRGLYA